MQCVEQAQNVIKLKRTASWYDKSGGGLCYLGGVEGGRGVAIPTLHITVRTLLHYML